MAALRVGTGREDRAVSGAQAHRIKLIAHLTRCLTFPLCSTVVGAGKGRGDSNRSGNADGDEERTGTKRDH